MNRVRPNDHAATLDLANDIVRRNGSATRREQANLLAQECGPWLLATDGIASGKAHQYVSIAAGERLAPSQVLELRKFNGLVSNFVRLHQRSRGESKTLSAPRTSGPIHTVYSQTLIEAKRVPEEQAEEGLAVERKVMTRKRNADIAQRRKERDKYTCAACGFRLQVGNRWIIECHHLYPLSMVGEGTVSIEDLVSLCPTCHRVAHTRCEPYSVQEVAELRKEAQACVSDP